MSSVDRLDLKYCANLLKEYFTVKESDGTRGGPRSGEERPPTVGGGLRNPVTLHLSVLDVVEWHREEFMRVCITTSRDTIHNSICMWGRKSFSDNLSRVRNRSSGLDVCTWVLSQPLRSTAGRNNSVIKPPKSITATDPTWASENVRVLCIFGMSAAPIVIIVHGWHPHMPRRVPLNLHLLYSCAISHYKVWYALCRTRCCVF